MTSMGLCLSGGGITGAMYEVGVLAALEEYFEGFEATSFDVLVGVGTGAAVAATLAGGMPALRLYRALLDPSDDFFPLRRQHLLRFDSSEFRRVARSTGSALRRTLASALSRPLEVDLWNEVDRFTDSLPAGLFSLDPFERFLEEVFTRRGIPNDFPSMPRTLRVVASDLDLGERVVFGGDDSVTVARAVAAACAVPLLYAPVRCGERECITATPGEAAHVDVAAELGCGMVLVVNALVPVRVDSGSRSVPTGHGPGTHVRDKGLLWVYNQSVRTAAAAQLARGLPRFRASHAELDVHLVEPARDDATMFMHSPMNFAARRVLLEDGYRTTIENLRAPDSPLRRAFEARGHRPVRDAGGPQ